MDLSFLSGGREEVKEADDWRRVGKVVTSFLQQINPRHSLTSHALSLIGYRKDAFAHDGVTVSRCKNAQNRNNDAFPHQSCFYYNKEWFFLLLTFTVRTRVHDGIVYSCDKCRKLLGGSGDVLSLSCFIRKHTHTHCRDGVWSFSGPFSPK